MSGGPRDFRGAILGAVVGLILPVVLILVGCGDARTPGSGPQYRATAPNDRPPVRQFAVYPLYAPEKLFAVYQPLVQDLNSHLNGGQFILEGSRDYHAFEAKVRRREPDVLLANAWQTLEAMKVGYRVIAMAGDTPEFRGIFIVRKDSGIVKPSDLRGKVVSYPSSTAFAACLMPQYYLYQQGIDVNRDVENRYVGSQESSIMNAFLGTSAAGATWYSPWRLFQKDHPREASELRVIWETPALINISIMVRDDLPVEVQQGIRQRLLALHETAAGRRVLLGMETARFKPADDDSYGPVRDFVAAFERDVRPVEAK
jgi:phosphonate transport system substrate-binding protein